MALTAPHSTEVVDHAIEALFEEAKARRRRRWVVSGSIAFIVMALLLLVAIVANNWGARSRSASSPTDRAGIAPRVARTTSAVAWVDYDGNLHVGNPNGSEQRIVRKIDANPTTPLVSVAGGLFWAGTSCAYLSQSHCYSPTSGFPISNVHEYDPASNRLRSLGAGTAVFASAGDRSVFVVGPRLDCPTPQSCDAHPEQVTRIPVGFNGIRHTFNVPYGWYVNSGAGLGDPIAVTEGILVQSEQAQTSAHAPELGLWQPGSDRVKVLGRDWGVAASRITGNGANLLAWFPGSCESDSHCSLLITDMATFKSVSVRSPLPYGFDLGGAFSPDGSQLAVFVKTNAGDLNPAMQLAIVNVHTGALRLIPGVAGQIGDSVGWAQWLPSGDQVLAGTFSSDYRTYNHYLVNARNEAAQLVDFSGNQDTDVNFSSAVISGLMPG